MGRPITNNSRRGDVVVDPFSGSGTTLIAAEQLHRVCLGMEIDPVYADVVVLRWEDFTGRKAVLDGSGRSFRQTAAARKRRNRING